MDLGSTGIYFRGAGEQAHNFSGFGEPCQKAKEIEEMPPFCLIFKKIFCVRGDSPPHPLVNSKCIYFRTNMHILIDPRENIFKLSWVAVDLLSLKLLILVGIIILWNAQIAPDRTIFTKKILGEHAPEPP